jgi:hypothetical protein
MSQIYLIVSLNTIHNPEDKLKITIYESWSVENMYGMW